MGRRRFSMKVHIRRPVAEQAAREAMLEMISEMMRNRKKDGNDVAGASGEAWSWGGHPERRVLMPALQEALGAGLWVSKPGG